MGKIIQKFNTPCSWMQNYASFARGLQDAAVEQVQRDGLKENATIVHGNYEHELGNFKKKC